MKKKLFDFLAAPSRWPNNAWVVYPGMRALYVRKSPVFIEPPCDAQTNRPLERGKWYDKVCTIANVTARRPGTGAFKRLVRELTAQGYAVYVENALSEQFREGLARLGFRPVSQLSGFHFLLNEDGHEVPAAEVY